MVEGVLPELRTKELVEKRKNITIEEEGVGWFFRELREHGIKQGDLFDISRDKKYRRKNRGVTKKQARWLLEELAFVGISTGELKKQVKKHGDEDENLKEGKDKFLVKFIDGFVLRSDSLPHAFRPVDLE